jgi:hypothetical protein
MSTKSLNELIGERAYQLYLQRGDEPGCAEDDWRRAEVEVTEELKKKEAAKAKPAEQPVKTAAPKAVFTPAPAPAPAKTEIKAVPKATPKAEAKPVPAAPVVKKVAPVVAAPAKKKAVKKGR